MNRATLLFVVTLAGCDGLLMVEVKDNTPVVARGGGVATMNGGGTAEGTGGGEMGGGDAMAGGATTMTGGGTTMVAPPRFTCSDPTAQGTSFQTLRRLTREELLATWRSVLGSAVADDAQVAAALTGLPSDELQTLTTLSDTVPPSWVPTLSTAAKRSATVLLGNATERARVLGSCSTQALTDPCVTQLITTFGARVYRRDLSTSEVQALLAWYRTAGSGEAGLGFLLRRLLQSPALAFHLEDRGTIDGARLRLTPFEVASRLSYLTTGTAPDDALFAAARANQLSTKAEVRAQVLRLLDTPQGHARVRAFFGYSLQLGQVSDPFGPLATFRGLSGAGLGQELRTEALDFSEQVFFDGADGTFRQLMTSTLAAPKTERVAKVFGQTCVGGTQAQVTTVPWNDPTTFFHADGSTPGPAVQTLTQNGWFVWQLPAARFAHAVTELRIELTAATTGTPLQFDLNLNDVPQLTNLSIPAGAGTIRATVAIPGGAATKVGLAFKNAGSGRSATLTSLVLSGGTTTTTQCHPMSAPTHPGLLHRPALLLGTAARTSPILRGAHVRKLFLCTNLGVPDPALVTARQMTVGSLDAVSNRERTTTLTSAPECLGCHGLINPLGFPFEAYDQAGMLRTEEQRFDAQGLPTTRMPIDPSVMNPYLDAVGGPSALADSKQLVEALAASRTAQACFTQRAFEFFRRAPLDLTKDGCALAAAESKVATGSLREVLADLLAADDVFFRPAP